MAKAYRKRSKMASLNSSGFVDKADSLAKNVHVQFPVSPAEIIAGVSDDIERLSGEAGLLIMQAVMKGEVDALARPKARHDPDREATRRTKQRAYVVMAGDKVPVTSHAGFVADVVRTADRSTGTAGRADDRRRQGGPENLRRRATSVDRGRVNDGREAVPSH